MPVTESESSEILKDSEPESVTVSEPVEPVPTEEPGSVTKVEPAEPESVVKVEPSVQAEEPVHTDQLTGSLKHTQGQASVPVQSDHKEPSPISTD